MYTWLSRNCLRNNEYEYSSCCKRCNCYIFWCGTLIPKYYWQCKNWVLLLIYKKKDHIKMEKVFIWCLTIWGEPDTSDQRQFRTKTLCNWFGGSELFRHFHTSAEETKRQFWPKCQTVLPCRHKCLTLWTQVSQPTYRCVSLNFGAILTTPLFETTIHITQRTPSA